ncbi:hypothetical protein [Solidesulfovibrio alcoholivorans]|uniref:hypothetical protein n=1 Tax=Solidesulfovibrio alcoholivorans TaxID=81406 RepID=UPI000ACBC569|nr:hypothetical protein [Solidesulfovibrio alcoholivorans]
MTLVLLQGRPRAAHEVVAARGRFAAISSGSGCASSEGGANPSELFPASLPMPDRRLLPSPDGPAFLWQREKGYFDLDYYFHLL